MTSHDRETFERHFAMSERDFGRMSESFCDHERLVIALAKYGLGARERRTATSGKDVRQPEIAKHRHIVVWKLCKCKPTLLSRRRFLHAWGVSD